MQKQNFTLDFEKPLWELSSQLEKLKDASSHSNVNVAVEIKAIEEKIEFTKKNIYSNLSAWQKVQLARHPQRPYSLDYIKAIFGDFQELHGDRCFKDDLAIIGGTAFLDHEPVMIIAQQKGRNTKENLLRNFGSPHPEGYRKALRLMRLAEKFKLPIITLVDTPGAYPGIGSEERHVAEAIAVNIREMSQLQVPIITTVIGEGGSGGALGIAVADVVLILESAYYSVISPEGCAAILWKNRSFAPQAAEALKLSAEQLKEFNVVEEIIKEPDGGAHTDSAAMAKSLRESILRHLKRLRKLSIDDLLEKRYQKFRNIGIYETLSL
jgi:acetyl-CoA carboxylase carboxyl transferase subunit alpha